MGKSNAQKEVERAAATVKTKMPSHTAQADPTAEEKEIFGEDPLSESEDFAPQGVAILVLPEPSSQLPLNQVPGKLRKFLTEKDFK